MGDRKRGQERGKRQPASRESEQSGAGPQQWTDGHSETERQSWFWGEGGVWKEAPGGQSQSWFGGV